MEFTGLQIAGLAIMVASILLIAWGLTKLDGNAGSGGNDSTGTDVEPVASSLKTSSRKGTKRHGRSTKKSSKR